MHEGSTWPEVGMATRNFSVQKCASIQLNPLSEFLNPPLEYIMWGQAWARLLMSHQWKRRSYRRLCKWRTQEQATKAEDFVYTTLSSVRPWALWMVTAQASLRGSCRREHGPPAEDRVRWSRVMETLGKWVLCKSQTWLWLRWGGWMELHHCGSRWPLLSPWIHWWDLCEICCQHDTSLTCQTNNGLQTTCIFWWGFSSIRLDGLDGSYSFAVVEMIHYLHGHVYVEVRLAFASHWELLVQLVSSSP